MNLCPAQIRRLGDEALGLLGHASQRALYGVQDLQERRLDMLERGNNALRARAVPSRLRHVIPPVEGASVSTPPPADKSELPGV